VSARIPRVLVAESDGFAGPAADLLRGVAQVVLGDLDRRGLVEAVGEADVLWVRLRHRIDAEVLTAAKHLRIIATPTTGLNHIDLEEAARRGVRVVSLRGQTDFLRDIRATAEHTLALILALLRRIPAAAAHVRDGGWDRDGFKGRELYGKTVGLVGYGRLGRLVARSLGALDTRVLAADPHIDPGTVEAGVRLVALPELLAEADLVSLHVNLDEKTRGVFGRAQFAAMKPGAWFINTSRGELIDEAALLEGLASGRLAGAAVDVLCDERPDGMGAHALVAYAREHEHLLVTPHIGGCTVESMAKTELFLAEQVVQLLRG
jgi:D-3-phosphoglycerate dehydrogenase